MYYTKRFFLIFISLFLLSNHSSAQSVQVKQIDSVLKWSSQNGIFNGNVLVSKKNKIIYNASFGYSDATKAIPLTPDYRFNTGSITKEFSAVALIQLKEQGKLQLEDKVSKFIPELPKWANEVSIKDLLQYTSGLPNVNWKAVQNDQDLFNGLMNVDTLTFKPGTAYDYNNNNIFLRHFIVERLTGMNYKDYVQQFLFLPCQMNTALMTPFENEENWAKGFNSKWIADKKDLPITGGTYLTVGDLLKWSNGLHGRRLISNQSLYELGNRFEQPDTQSALGNATFKNKKLVAHEHHGRAGSYEALLVSDIEEKFTIIVVSNNYSGKVFEISEAIKAILKNQKYSLPTKITVP